MIYYYKPKLKPFMKLKFLLTTMMLCFALSMQAQNITVTGSVTSSDDGTELIGVNVFEKIWTSSFYAGDYIKKQN